MGFELCSIRNAHYRLHAALAHPTKLNTVNILSY